MREVVIQRKMEKATTSSNKKEVEVRTSWESSDQDDESDRRNPVAKRPKEEKQKLVSVSLSEESVAYTPEKNVLLVFC